MAALFIVGLVAAFWIVRHRPDARNVSEPAGWQSSVVHVTNAVDYRYFVEGSQVTGSANSDALILDIDLGSPTVRLQVAADNPERRNTGQVFGTAHTVRDWCLMNKAFAGVNGGFFGKTEGDQKQAEGMLAVDGKIYNSGRWIKSTRRPGESFLRCAFAIGVDGSPHIGWAICHSGGEMDLYNRPLSPANSTSLRVTSAVACGPRLVAGGKEDVTDAKERLVSGSAVPRTFVAYDVAHDARSGQILPKHFVMGIAMQMTYHEVALFLRNYYRVQHHTECAEAMCLDGGSSSQLTFHAPSTKRDTGQQNSPADEWVDARLSHVTVPTAILVMPAGK